MAGAGFSGPWSELRTGYRMPRALQRLTDMLADEFSLDGMEERNQRHPQQELEFCELEWTQVEDAELLNALVTSFHDLGGSDSTFGMSDINFIVDTKAIGRALVGELEQLGVKTISTFADDHDAERLAKHRFFAGEGKVKVTTIHSFKGWEAPVLVVGIGDSDASLVYTALTRLSRSEEGSHLRVVCGDRRFASFGTRWRSPSANT